MNPVLVRRALLVLLALAISGIAFPHLPERVPLHWQLNGAVDRWGSRVEGAFLAPLVMLLVWGVAHLAPRVDPRGASYARMRGAYTLAIDAILVFLLVVHGLLLAAGLGYDMPVGRVVPASVGALLIVIGNILPRARPNWTFGIRTPWTLSSDRVWTRTHRLGGYLMAAAGVAMLIAAALPARWSGAVLLGAVLLGAVVPAVYSYFAWRREGSR